MTPFRRLLPSEYGPDVNNTKRGLRVANDSSPLPNARILSNELSTTTNGEQEDTTSPFMSVYVMQMGQFLDHDFAHSPMFEIPKDESCCGPIENRNEHCIPIDIPSDDPFFSDLSEPINCMPMARSMTSPDLDCAINIERQQVVI